MTDENTAAKNTANQEGGTETPSANKELELYEYFNRAVQGIFTTKLPSAATLS